MWAISVRVRRPAGRSGTGGPEEPGRGCPRGLCARQRWRPRLTLRLSVGGCWPPRRVARRRCGSTSRSAGQGPLRRTGLTESAACGRSAFPSASQSMPSLGALVACSQEAAPRSSGSARWSRYGRLRSLGNAATVGSVIAPTSAAAGSVRSQATTVAGPSSRGAQLDGFGRQGVVWRRALPGAWLLSVRPPERGAG